MAQSAVYLFVVVAVAVIVESNGQSAPLCPVNSTPSRCPQRLRCRPSCAHPNGTPICTADCDLNHPCVCNPGYLNYKGKCVKPSQCPHGAHPCPANEVWTDCAQLRSCRPTCAKPNGAPICPAICVADCVCKPGFILNANGKCIKKANCPK